MVSVVIPTMCSRKEKQREHSLTEYVKQKLIGETNMLGNTPLNDQ